ncbi:pyridoxal phosphate-dependent aminotransferase [Bacillota bacterium]
MKKLSSSMTEMEVSSVRKLTVYADRAKAAGKKVYHLNIGQPDLPVPEEYYEYIRKFHEPTVEYMPSQGLPELLSAMEKFYRNSGFNISRDNIAVTTGGSEGVLMTLQSLADPGDEFIVFEPYYSNYNTYFTMSGSVPVPVRTYAKNGFHIEKRAIEEKITERTKAIIVTNPGNPTGTVLTAAELRIIADIAKEHDLYIISDEVYREIVFDGREITSFGKLEDIADRLIVIDSVSKRFSACGARIGAVITRNKELFNLVYKLCQGRLSVSTIEQHGAAGLYTAGNRVIDSVRDEFEKRRDAVYEALGKLPGVEFNKPEGAFYMMCRLPVEDATDFLIWMLEKFDIDGETVMAAPGEGFYATKGLGKNEIRLAFTLECELLEKAVRILGEGLDEYRKAAAPAS